MMKWLLVTIAACLAVAPAVAQAPGRGMHRPGVPPHLLIERLSRMTPEQRQNLLGGLPDDRRSLLEERLRKYNQMPAEAKRRLRDEYNLFEQLPPERQEKMRKLFRKLNDFPADRRRLIRRELVRLRNLSAERRTGRMNSPAFKETYSDAEREFLTALTDLFARAATDN